MQVAICDEIAAWVRTAIAPVAIDDETLALDLVDRIGPEGSFLETDHTVAHYRERWYPTLMNRQPYATWLARGGTTLAERAAQRVDRLLASHGPPPLPDAARNAIDEILERAARTPRTAPQP